MIAGLPAGDLIMDVTRAARPEKARATIARLESAGGAQASFASVAEGLANARDVIGTGAGNVSAKAENTKATSNRSAGFAFEAMMLQALIQNMMPQSTKTAFGAGVAGGAYKMLMAEQIAAQVAGAGGVGVAGLIDRRLAPRDLPADPVLPGRPAHV